MSEDCIKKKDFCIVQVQFEGSTKQYDYYIDVSIKDNLQVGKRYNIMNESFYTYRNGEVIIKKFLSIPCQHSATRRIIALKAIGAPDCYIDWDFLRTRVKGNPQDFAYRIEEIFRDAGYPTYRLPFYRELAPIESRKDTIIEIMKKNYEKEYDIKNNNDNNKRRKSNMNIFNGFNFGKVTESIYAITLKGIAFFSNNESYIQYNPEKNEFEDVTPFVLRDICPQEFLYKIPVALSQVKEGDIIFDGVSPVFIKKIDGSELTVVDPSTREVRIILATKNMFNFNFVTKLVNLMENFNLMSSATENNPFGNILPLILLSDNKNMNDMLPLMLLSNGGVADFASNPMMLYFLMKDGKSNDLLPLFLMNNGSLFNTQEKIE